MKSITLAIAAVVTLGTGTAGAVIAYAAAAPGATAAPRAVREPETAAPPIARPAPKLVVRYRHCPSGSVRNGKTCVRHVVHTIAVAPPPSLTVSTSGGRSEPSRARHHGEDAHTGTSRADDTEPADQHHSGDDRPGGEDRDQGEHQDAGVGAPAPGD